MAGIRLDGVTTPSRGSRIGSFSVGPSNDGNIYGLDERIGTSSGILDGNIHDDEDRHCDGAEGSFDRHHSADGDDHETTTIMASSPSPSTVLPLHSTLTNDASYAHRNSLSKRSHPTPPVAAANGAGGGNNGSCRTAPYRTEVHPSRNGSFGNKIGNGMAGSSSLNMTPPVPGSEYVVGPSRAGPGPRSNKPATTAKGWPPPGASDSSSNSNHHTTMKTPRKGSLRHSVNGGSVATVALSLSSLTSPPPRRPSSALSGPSTSSSVWLKDGRRRRPWGVPSFTLALALVIAVSCCSYLYTAVTLIKASSTTDAAATKPTTNAGGAADASAEDVPMQLNQEGGSGGVGGGSSVAGSSGGGSSPHKAIQEGRNIPSRPSPVRNDEVRGGGTTKNSIKNTTQPLPPPTPPNRKDDPVTEHPPLGTSMSSSFPRIILAGVGTQFRTDDGGGTVRLWRKRPRTVMAVPLSPLEPPPMAGTQNTTTPSGAVLREFDLSDVPFFIDEGEGDDGRPTQGQQGDPPSEPSTMGAGNGTRPSADDPNHQPQEQEEGHETQQNPPSRSCVPKGEWMTASYVNCNSIHELDMGGSVSQKDLTDLVLLGEGWFRSTWKYATGVGASGSGGGGKPPASATSSTVVLKTLRIEREFLEEYFDLHRRDAVAMERLTFSPYVMDVYGYCGQSAINELAEGMAGGQVASLEQLNRRMRGKESDERFLFLKLQLASDIATGLAHVHNVDVSGDYKGGISPSAARLLDGSEGNAGNHTMPGDSAGPTMAHYDINPRNIAIMKDGRPKLNDFNIAEFLTYDPTTNQSCGFRSRLHEPWWRAPEEMDLSHATMVTEKVDVYALGNVLFHILTTHSPRGKMNKEERMDQVRRQVREGERPKMLEPYASNPSLRKHRIVKAFVKAMDLCYEKDPHKRGTAIEVARVLRKALHREEVERQHHKKKDKSPSRDG
jgi:serine/threonine protein kinase